MKAAQKQRLGQMNDFRFPFHLSRSIAAACHSRCFWSCPLCVLFISDPLVYLRCSGYRIGFRTRKVVGIEFKTLEHRNQKIAFLRSQKFTGSTNRTGEDYKILLHTLLSHRLICARLWLGLGGYRCGCRGGRSRDVWRGCWLVDVLVSASCRGETPRHAPD